MKPCAHCLINPAKKKYCSYACSNEARRVIDPAKIEQLRSQGLSYVQIEAYVPATADSIRKAMSRHRAAA